MMLHSKLSEQKEGGLGTWNLTSVACANRIEHMLNHMLPRRCASAKKKQYRGTVKRDIRFLDQRAALILCD